jgi:hypothetical protein
MKKKDILVILIPSFICVLAWIIFSVIHSYLSPTVSKSINIEVTPIEPNFDTKTLELIKQRQVIEPIFEIKTFTLDLNSLQATKSAIKKTTTKTNVASKSATIVPTPTLEQTQIEDTGAGAGIDATDQATP